MFYLRDPKPVALQTELAMYYEIVKFPAVGIAVCRHPVTRSGLIKAGFKDITDEIAKAGGLESYVVTAGLTLRNIGRARSVESEHQEKPKAEVEVQESTVEPEEKPNLVKPLTYEQLRRMSKPELLGLVRERGIEVDKNVPNFRLVSQIWKAVK